MSESVPLVWPAPAKLNLFLHVLGKRTDGYHEIQTLYQIIDLCDELQIEVTEKSAIVRPAADYAVSEQNDLVVRAAKLLQSETQTQSGAIIRVHKRIPIGAGLGGGSSDAATTLLVLNGLWQCRLEIRELASIGARLGADIPVFIHGNSALASGIGEKLQASSLGARHYVLVFNNRSISTKEVFQHTQLPRDSLPISLATALAGGGKNDCEKVVRIVYAEFVDLMQELKTWGEPRMTGTGSCIFLQMADEKAAIKAADEIKCRYNVSAVRGLDKSPVHELLRFTIENA